MRALSRWATGLCFAIAFVLWLYSQSTQVRELTTAPSLATTTSESSATICIVGNVENMMAAYRVHAMWSCQITSFWYVWNELVPLNHPQQQPCDHHGHQLFVVDSSLKDKAKSFKQGISATTAAALQRDCEYIFTHDDDLVFVTSVGQPLTTVLQAWLTLYTPLVAGFPWAVGRQRYPSLAEVTRRHRHGDSSPLLLFDNGMLIYHRSIISFFIPFAPSGEGGFDGHWTLGAHFLHLFVPQLLQQRALTCELLTYDNTINLDNLDKTAKRKGRRVDKQLVYYQGVRHPYEYMSNAAYIAFLASGLKDPSLRFGAAVDNSSLTWNTARRSDVNVSVQDLLQTLAGFYYLGHPALSTNIWLQSHQAIAQQTQHTTQLHLHIHLFVHTRLELFLRLWAQLSANAPPSSLISVRLYVHYDPSDDPLLNDRVAQALSDLHSPFGDVKVITLKVKQGLRASILATTPPTHADHFVMLLEDDLVLSPFALRYAELMLRKYFTIWDASRVMGLSLYAQLWSEVTESYRDGCGAEGRLGQRYGLELWQQPQSWGSIYRATHWNAFTTWVKAKPKDEPYLLPHSYTNRWPEAFSWKKAMFRYLVDQNLTMLYPRLPGRLSLSSNTLAVGQNDRVSHRSSKRKRQESRFVLAVLQDHHLDSVGLAVLRSSATSWQAAMAASTSPVWNALPTLATLPVTDVYGQYPNTSKLPANNYDNVTVVALITDEGQLAQLRQLCSHPRFRILTVVSRRALAVDHVPCMLASVAIDPRLVPDWLAHSSVLEALELIADAPLLVLDARFPLSLEAAQYLVATWQGHYWDHWVSASNAGRNHASADWSYLRSSTEVVSWLLPTHVVLSRQLWLQHVRTLQQLHVEPECLWLGVQFQQHTGTCPAIVASSSSWDALPIAYADETLEKWLPHCVRDLQSKGVVPAQLRSTAFARMDQNYGSSTRYINREWLKCA